MPLALAEVRRCGQDRLKAWFIPAQGKRPGFIAIKITIQSAESAFHISRFFVDQDWETIQFHTCRVVGVGGSVQRQGCEQREKPSCSVWKFALRWRCQDAPAQPQSDFA